MTYVVGYLLLLLPLQLVQAGADTTDVVSNPNLGPSILLDYPLTPRAGAALMMGATDAFYLLEDRFIPVRFSEEHGFFSKSLGFLYRAARLSLLDVPLDILHDTFRHELLGHGGRGRLAGGEAVEYHVALPPPYGLGGGSANFDFDQSELSDHELAAFAAGGLEVTLLSVRALEERWLVRESMDFRESMNYVTGILGNYGYVRDAGAGWVRHGHDVENYLNVVAGTDEPNVDPDDVARLRSRVRIELFNFQLYLAVSHILWDFLVQGDSDIPAFRIPIGRMRLTPQSHLWLAPYGPEMEFRMLGVLDERLYGMHVRKGSGVRSLSFGIKVTDFFSRSDWRLDLQAEAWRQPQLYMEPVEKSGKEESRGFLASITGHADVGMPFRIVGEVGGKTRGFVPGEMLSAGPILRIGIEWSAIR